VCYNFQDEENAGGCRRWIGFSYAENAMSENSLEDFFREKKKAHGPRIDWEQRKQEWIGAVTSLYETIRGQYLAEPINKGLVTVSTVNKTVDEPLIGSYEIPELVLQVDDERAVFSPKGRNVAGASGRIDFVGRFGERTLVLQPGGWMLVIRRTPSVKLVPFDAESLLQALKDVMGQ
jgi:hypothetical protein